MSEEIIKNLKYQLSWKEDGIVETIFTKMCNEIAELKSKLEIAEYVISKRTDTKFRYKSFLENPEEFEKVKNNE